MLMLRPSANDRFRRKFMTALVWCQKDPNAEGKNMQKKKSLNTQQKYTFTNKNSSKIVLKNYFFFFYAKEIFLKVYLKLFDMWMWMWKPWIVYPLADSVQIYVFCGIITRSPKDELLLSGSREDLPKRGSSSAAAAAAKPREKCSKVFYCRRPCALHLFFDDDKF